MPTAVSAGRPCNEAAPAAYTGPVWRLPAIFVVMSHFMEVILVELPYEACEVAVLEVLGQDRLCESFVLRRRSISCWISCFLYGNPRYLEDHKASTIISPSYDL